MTELLTAAQMRAIEQAAIESGDVTGLELMERAGQGVVDAIFKEWPELLDADAEGGAAPRPADSPRSISAKKKRAVVLCGPGNNVVWKSSFCRTRPDSDLNPHLGATHRPCALRLFLCALW